MHVNAQRKRSPLWSMRLGFLVAVSVLLMGSMSIFASWNLRAQRLESESVLHGEQVRYQLSLTEQLLITTATGARGYALSGDDLTLQSYRDASLKLAPEVLRLQGLVANVATQRGLADRLHAAVDRLAAFNSQLLQAARDQDARRLRELIATGQEERLISDARSVVTAMQRDEERQLGIRKAVTNRARNGVAAVLWGTGALGSLLVVLVVYFTRRDEDKLRTAEGELATTLRSIGDAVISTDTARSIRFMNPAAESLTGWTARDARGLPFERVFHVQQEEAHRLVDDASELAVRAGNSTGPAGQTVLTSRDGSERPIAYSAAPIVDDMTEFKGMVLVFRDVSAQRNAELALRLREMELQVVNDHARFPIARCDHEHKFLFVNRAYAERLGLTPERCVGRHIREVAGELAYETVRPQIEKALSGVPVEFEINVPYATGARFMRCIYSPDRDEHGRVRSFVAAVTDITDLKRTEDALRASEARFRAVQETSIDGFMVLESRRDAAGRIIDFLWVYANEASERILGKPRGWFLGRSLLEERPHNRGRLFEAYVRVVETGEPWSGESAFQNEDDEWYLRIAAAKSEDGIAVTFTDMSERRRAEIQLKDRERQFVGLANAIPQLAWTENAQGRHEYFNRGWYAYTGLPEAQALDRGAWAQVTHPEDLPRSAEKWRHSLRTGEPYECELRLRRHDGVYRWFLARAIADRVGDGKIVQWFGTCTDIDASKRIEADLRNTEAALREADTRKDIFLATLAHELRNPLAPIRTAAEILGAAHLTPEQLQWSQRVIHRQVKHMALLLDDLLDMARVTQGKLALKVERVSLSSIVDAAVESARPLLEAKNHRLSVELPACPLQLDVDPLRLAQVLSNLLTNAAKYTAAGGHIELRAAAIDGTLRLAVRDNGIGIAGESLPHIFEIFSQVDGSSGRADGGLGIGLALVKGLTEMHGGTVEATSDGPGRGCEFTILLPVRITGSESEPVPPVKAAGGAALPAPSGRRVLVADDNKDAADSLAMLLELSGHEVRVAHSGRAALSVAASFRPDATLLDIGMPELDGYEVARKLRREPWGTEIHLIALTGWGQQDDRRRAQEAGFDHHLTKPVDLTVLESLLATGNSVQGLS